MPLNISHLLELFGEHYIEISNTINESIKITTAIISLLFSVLIAYITEMEIKDIINILAIIVSPIIAVLIARSSENRSRKRDDKMKIFMVLITGAAHLSGIGNWKAECVEALNQINIVFRDDKDVLQRWKEYYDLLCKSTNNDTILNERGTAILNMLKAMARSLGYKDFLLNEKDNSLYFPRGMRNVFYTEEKFKMMQEEALTSLVKNRRIRKSIWIKRNN